MFCCGIGVTAACKGSEQRLDVVRWDSRRDGEGKGTQETAPPRVLFSRTNREAQRKRERNEAENHLVLSPSN